MKNEIKFQDSKLGRKRESQIVEILTGLPLSIIDPSMDNGCSQYPSLLFVPEKGTKINLAWILAEKEHENDLVIVPEGRVVNYNNGDIGYLPPKERGDFPQAIYSLQEENPHLFCRRIIYNRKNRKVELSSLFYLDLQT